MVENNESQKTEEKTIAVRPTIKVNAKGIILQTYDDMYRFAKSIQLSKLAPDSFVTPEQILVALQAGAELGLSPIRSLGSLYVVKGNVRLWGDTPLALVRQSGLMEYIKEWMEGDIGKDLTKTSDDVKAVCETKRKNDPEPIQREFTVEQARLAGLWNKKTDRGFNTVWVNYPKRMLQMRARALNLRDNFPDALGGATIAEEYEGIEMGEAPLNDKPRSAVLLEESKPEQPEIATEIPEITPTKPAEPQTPLATTNSTTKVIIKAPKRRGRLEKAVGEQEAHKENVLVESQVQFKEPLSKEEVEKNAEEIFREHAFKCNKCGYLFDEPGGMGKKPLCPKCLSSKIIEF